MYCKKHEGMIRCCSIMTSDCESCGIKFVTGNAPPLNKICRGCSDKLGKCEYCRGSLKEEY